MVWGCEVVRGVWCGIVCDVGFCVVWSVGWCVIYYPRLPCSLLCSYSTSMYILSIQFANSARKVMNMPIVNRVSVVH